MSSKHLKKANTASGTKKEPKTAPAEPKAIEAQDAGATKKFTPAKVADKPVKDGKTTSKKADKESKAAAEKTEKAGKDTEKKAEKAEAKTEKTKKDAKKDEKAPKKASKTTGKAFDFKQEPTSEEKLSRNDKRKTVITLIAAAILLAAVVVIWLYRDSFHPDMLILSAEKVAAPEAEYIFETGSGQVFAAAGDGLAAAATSGLELIGSDGQIAASHLMQMTTPAIAACGDYAVFYDVGGTNIAAARFDGAVTELTAEGKIFSASVSEGGYLAVTTECTGYRGLVTVYAPTLEPVYQWYSSSAWVISANVSPDNRSLAVLSYTASGSEVRFFSLNKTEQQAAFSVSDTILLNVHWFTANQLCAYSTEEALFFDSEGSWNNTFSFEGRYLTDCTDTGEGCITFALSPYRAGTTATLVSLDAAGKKLGEADVQSEIVSLTASGTELLVLCPDGAILYSSSLTEKGRLSGLSGFKYGLLRSRGEALLVSSNYAEVYTF